MTTDELDNGREPDIEALDLSKVPNPLARSVAMFNVRTFNNKKMDPENARLFVSPVIRNYIMTLSRSGKELLLWMLYKIEWGRDSMKITHERVGRYYKVDKRTYDAAVSDLVEKEIILLSEPLLNGKKKASTTEGLFWINPHVFFRGQRFAFYRKQLAEMGEMKYLSWDPDLPPEHEQPAIPASKQSRMFPPGK